MSRKVEDRGGTATATKVEGTTIGFGRMVAGLPASDLPSTPLQAHNVGPGQGGVTVTGPGLVVSSSGSFPRVLAHGPIVYREGTTITPAPAHAAQPNTIIHQQLSKQENISLPQTPVTVQYSTFPKSIASAPSSITVAVSTQGTPLVHNMQIHQSPGGHINVQKVAQAHGAMAFGGAQNVRAAPTTPLGGLSQQSQQQQQQQQQPAAGGPPSSQPPSFQRLKVEDALSYLDQVKFKFGNQPQVYNDFLDIMKEFKSQSIDTPGVISRVSMLFKGHPELIVGFNTFLPPGYKIEVQTNEQAGHQNLPHQLQSLFQTIVHTPHGTHMMGNHGVMGPAMPATSIQSLISSTPVTVRPVTVQPTPKYVKTIPESVAITPTVAATVPARGEQTSFPPTTPLQTPIITLPTTMAPPSLNILNSINPNTLPTPGGNQPGNQPVEFNHAINYVNKIKNRFQGQPDVYKQFLEILHTYQKDQRAIKEGGAPKSHLTESEVYAQVSRLFQNQEDLLSEFGQFLPEATNDHSTAAIMVSSKGLSNDHVSATAVTKRPNVKHPNQNSGPLIPKLEPRSNLVNNENLKRPLQQGRMQPPSKKPKMGVLKDVSLAEAGRYGSLSDYAFFDKVRKALKNNEVYQNFLRCLSLYNQEIVNRVELIQISSPFLSKHPELLKWFKDFVGLRDDGGNYSMDPVIGGGEHGRPRQERVSGDTAMEIDYASCKRLGASYCALPRNFVQPKCSGRAQGTPQGNIFKEVLNDTWVSFPSWSEDSQFVSSRKSQCEEAIYRTEDERFEFDVVLETNRDTIKVLECVQKKMARMPPEEAARYRLDECLGGTSPTIHQRAIRRIYGDKSADIIDGLKRNPVVAVPLVLRRLKAKDTEWREVQKQFNKVWRDQNEKYYLKSLDHQGMIFKQNDIRAIRSKSLLNEIETLYDEQHEQMEQTGNSYNYGVPHLTLNYRDKAVLDDASSLLIHHVKRQTSIHKEDKQKIKVLLKQSLPDMFFHTRQDMSDTESEKDEEDSEKEDSDNEHKAKVKNNKEEAKDISVKEEDVLAEIKDGDLPSHAKSVKTTESYSLLMANNHWYLFLRLHNTLCERLATMYDHSLVIAAEEGEESKSRSESTAAALNLRPKAGLSPSDYYPAFKDMLSNVLDGNMESIAFEDTLREMFGIHAFKVFTLDKVIANCVRQLQHLVTDESSVECWELYQSEKKNNGTGGEVSTADKRCFAELLYQKKSEKILADENCFKIVLYRDSANMTVELLDTETESRQGNSEAEEEEDEDEEGKQDQQQLEQYVARFLGPGEQNVNSLCPNTMVHLARKPVFLSRSVRSYRAKTRHKIVPRPIAKEKEEKKEEPVPVLPLPAAPPNRQGKLNLSDSTIMWEEADTGGCIINNDFKILWVVNSENYIYKKNALNIAKKTHPAVCRRKYKAMSSWHSSWAAQHVSEAAQSRHNDWMLGRVEGLRTNKTHRLTLSDLNKTPYRTFTKFQVGEISPS